MTDRLDVVAVWVAHEHGVVAGVILRPFPWGVQDLATPPNRGPMDGLNGIAVAGSKRDMRLSAARVGRGTYPKHGWAAVHTEADYVPEVDNRAGSERLKNRRVPRGRRINVVNLKT